jgi:hypothetical protein
MKTNSYRAAARILTAMTWLLLGAPAFSQSQLKIVAIEGGGAFNNLKLRLGRDLLVEVRDETGRPLADAEVTFELPASGASGTFRGGALTQKVRTDNTGQARSIGLTPNDIEGRFTIKIRASKDGADGTTTIAQSNTLAGGITGGESKGSSKKFWVLGLLGGAAATAGVVLATQGGGSSSPSGPAPGIGLSISGVSVGAPR